jgi:hypothetical protein
MQNRVEPWKASPSPVVLSRGPFSDRPYDKNFASRFPPLDGAVSSNHPIWRHHCQSDSRVVSMPQANDHMLSLVMM